MIVVCFVSSIGQIFNKKYSKRLCLIFPMRGERIPIPLKVGHNRPARETPLKYHTLNAGLVLQGIRTSIAKKPYIFVIFQGGGGVSGPPVPPLDPHIVSTQFECISPPPGKFKPRV